MVLQMIIDTLKDHKLINISHYSTTLCVYDMQALVSGLTFHHHQLY